MSFDPSIIMGAAGAALAGALFGFKRLKRAGKPRPLGTGKHVCAYSKCDNMVPAKPYIQFFCSKRCRLLARGKRGKRIVRRLDALAA